MFKEDSDGGMRRIIKIRKKYFICESDFLDLGS